MREEENAEIDLSQKSTVQPDAAQENATLAEPVGRIAAPRGCEATTEKFHFWIGRGQLVEDNQFVHLQSATNVVLF